MTPQQFVAKWSRIQQKETAVYQSHFNDICQLVGHNPPLLITSDIHTVVIHTNFTNYPTRQHTITFDDIVSGEGLEKLRWAFFTPEKTRANITKATADTLLAVADTLLAVAEQMKKHCDLLGEGAYSNEQLAHFLVRLLFALFAEDMGLPAR